MKGYVSAFCEFFFIDNHGRRVYRRKVYGYSHVDEINTQLQREFLLRNAIQHGASKYLYAIKQSSDFEYGYTLIEARTHRVSELEAGASHHKHISKRKYNPSTERKQVVHQQVMTANRERLEQKKMTIREINKEKLTREQLVRENARKDEEIRNLRKQLERQQGGTIGNKSKISATQRKRKK